MPWTNEQLFDAAPDAMVITAPDGRIRFVNEKCRRMLGRTADEFCDTPVTQWFTGVGPYDVVRSLQNTAATGGHERGACLAPGAVEGPLLGHYAVCRITHPDQPDHLLWIIRPEHDAAAAQHGQTLDIIWRILDAFPVCVSYIDADERYRYVN